jgi:N-acetylglucosaminyldiphosphoundecaprenol N-acetyl-beta-D-mannosaminyltransferase
MLFLIFLGAALLSACGLLLADKFRNTAGPRPEGMAFVAAVLIPAFIGLYFATSYGSNRLDGAPVVSLESVPNPPLNSPFFYEGGLLLLLGLAIYLLSALRGLLKLPSWVADIIVIGAAFAATRVTSEVLIQISQSSQPDSPSFQLGPFDTILSVLWIWLVSRLCASLNRVPAVAGGYVGLLGFTVLMLLVAQATSNNPFAPITTSALAGAGLMSFVMVFRRPQINLGWSSILATGYLMGVSTSIGLLKDTLPAMLALAVLALGLPLLNVSIVKVRAKLRGHEVEWTNQRLRLDQALANRGVPARKIALYYFSVGAWLCLLAYLSARAFFGAPVGIVLGIIYTIILLALAAGGAIVFFSLARLQMRRQPEEEIPESIEAFGVKISPVSMTEALDKIEGFIATGKPHHVLTSDANAILTSRKDEEYANIMRRAAMITPDGFGVIWGARLLNLPIYERVTGVDMVTGICERAAKNGYRIFIFGSKPGTASTAAQNLQQRYPGLQVAGTHHGMVMKDPEALAKVVQQIRDCKPDVLFVAMGIPLQEKFIAQHLEEMGVPVSLGVGGSFDVYAGTFNRAPEAIQRIGLEWLYRVWIEPSRWKRMGYVPKFMLVALKTWLFGPRNGKTEAF